MTTGLAAGMNHGISCAWGGRWLSLSAASRANGGRGKRNAPRRGEAVGALFCNVRGRDPRPEPAADEEKYLAPLRQRSTKP